MPWEALYVMKVDQRSSRELVRGCPIDPRVIHELLEKTTGNRRWVRQEMETEETLVNLQTLPETFGGAIP